MTQPEVTATGAVNSVHRELAELHTRFEAADMTLTTEFDPDWASACEQGQPYRASDSDSAEQLVRWRPVPRFDANLGLPNDFAGLENALETPVHEDFKAYFSSFWSGTLECTAPEGHVSLLQLWNPQDVDRLVENMIGHVLGQRRARAPLTLFIACTEPDSDLILSLENATGAVLLERPGSKPLRTAAPSIAQLLASLTPAAP